ncbi:MAG: hypothetical protein COB15_11725 [Flavobacteriales bacterium]|nr:MAG: hypothetical protein COB15_11725 [Flavobacteriales bacterium]
MPHQFIFFNYDSYGEFNFFKEFSAEYQERFNEALRPPAEHGPFSTASGYPSLEVVTDVILKKVNSTYHATIDQVVLEYENETHYGPDMLNPVLSDVKQLDDLYSYKSVYRTTDILATDTTPQQNGTDFNHWKRYFHAKHPDIVDNVLGGSWNVQPLATNPFIASGGGSGGTFGSNVGTPGNTNVILRKNVSTTHALEFDHCFLESPRLNNSTSSGRVPIIGGDIYEIKSRISSDANNFAYGYANVDINIVTGKPAPGGDAAVQYQAYSFEVLNATKRNNYHVNETVFSTFGNAVKWNPVHNGGATTVETSNYFTMPNIPDSNQGITIQIGPGNSDNYFGMTPSDVTGITKDGVVESVDWPAFGGNSPYNQTPNAHRTYWAENWRFTSPLWTKGNINRSPIKQPYEAVPHNFGIGLPWMMMKPLAHEMLGNITPDENSPMFQFWWYDQEPGIVFQAATLAGYGPYGSNQTPNYNVPTLLDENTNVSNVELIRYSKTPYMLQSVKTYKTNGITTDSQHANPGIILVNQFDMDYEHETVAIIDNQIYNNHNNIIVDAANRYTTAYLLKNIKNVPVNGSQDSLNILPISTAEVPTTHFEYETFAPNLPLNGLSNIRTNASLFVLSKTTSHLGKETAIEYFQFADSTYPNMTFAFYRHLGLSDLDPNPNNSIDWKSITARNFAVQINIPVKTIQITDPTIGTAKQWNYNYETSTFKYNPIVGLRGNIQDNALKSSSRSGQMGWKTTTVTEPVINGLRPYSKYYHHGKIGTHFANQSYESLLHGKLNKVENYDGNHFKLSQKEIEYKAELAFTNGVNRNGYASRADYQAKYYTDVVVNTTWQVGAIVWEITTDVSAGIPYTYIKTSTYNGTLLTDTSYTSLNSVYDSFPSRVDFWYYDYQDCDEDPNHIVTIAHRPYIKSGIGGNTTIAAASTCMEISFPVDDNGTVYAKDSYFIKKVKEIDTEYEATVCNVPTVVVDGIPTSDPMDRAGAYPPLEPITNIKTKDGDDVLIGLINTNRFGKKIQVELIAASPLSDDVISALIDKRPYYRPKTYNTILEKQGSLSDAIFNKILALPPLLRDKTLRKAMLNQQYQLSADVLRLIIAEQPQVTPALLKNALQQYNALPEDILLSIINKKPKYQPGFIASVLLKQVNLSENVHQLLLTKKYLPNNVIKRVFVDGASYPSENVLTTMINRKPYIKPRAYKTRSLKSSYKYRPRAIKTVLLKSPYQHTDPTMRALDARFGSNSPIREEIGVYNSSLPSWSTYCANPSSTVPLSIQNITEYEYWDANECGETTSDGFYKLLDVDSNVHPTIDLMFEPSWQLYKTKSYSPQLADAFTEKEYFYYYDLKNKYQRREDYIDPTNPNYLYLDEADAVSMLQTGINVHEFDIMYYDYPQYGNNVYYSFGYGINSLRGFQPPGLKFSHELNLMNIAYQERTTSKNVSDANPITRSTFYHYDNDWNEIIDNHYVDVIEYSLGEPCREGPSLTGDPFIDGGCSWVYKLNHLDISAVGPGYSVYISDRDLVYVCPCELDTTGLNITTVYYDNCLINELPNGSSGRMAWKNDLNKTLLLKEVNTQIDNLVNDDYYDSLDSIPFPSSTGLMEFKYAGKENSVYSDKDLYKVEYPFDVLKVKEIKERNHFTQVQLEENEQGLLTRYWYTSSNNLWYNNTDCTNSFGNYSGLKSYNIGVPIAITVGYTRSDSLRTDYEYFPDYSVKRIIDPNGITLSYQYDEYGRLKKSFRNNKLLSMNKYSTWNNDTTLSFTNRGLQNYVETFQFKDDGDVAALQSRKYIDPLGRDFHTMSRAVPDAFNTVLGNSGDMVTHTGAIIYDNWNRAVETYKPFVDGDGTSFTPFRYAASSLTNSTTNSNTYPDTSSFATYENNQKSRVLREAKPGEAMNTAHNVKYRYSMANYVCGGCELELTAEESNLLMGNNPVDVRFKVVEVEDEDGKISKEYFNALGQKVATKQFIGTEDAITLFIYDSYGNLTKVINPEKQESIYDYNMLGWLYQKETVDGGITKYMFNESGQVVLEQDENGRNAKSCTEQVPVYDPETGIDWYDFKSRPYYRRYAYDIFGRLTHQDKVIYEQFDLQYEISTQFPLLYEDFSKNIIKSTIDNGNNVELFHDGYFYEIDPSVTVQPSMVNAVIYKFTNNSTYAWKANTYFYDNIFTGNSYAFNSHNNFVGGLGITREFPEKRFSYGHYGYTSPNFHAATNALAAVAPRNHMRGNLDFAVTFNNSHCEQVPFPVKYDIYNYNMDGNLLWQMQQFNANGINANQLGIVTRIDYPKYDLNNNLLVENIDVNNDLELDLQYNYTYDLRNRLKEVRAGLTNDATRELLASYQYNDATGLVTKTNYHKECALGNSVVTDEIEYVYDVRDRLNNINGRFFDYALSYDNNMPNTSLNNSINTIANFNGNINGTQAKYEFANMSNYITGSNFDKSSAYAYRYDGINRLTYADGFWSEIGATNNLNSIVGKHGDVSYKFDKIGNLTSLNRFVNAANINHKWNYQYQAGTNILDKVATQNTNAADRNYTYDDAGNLLTDDYRSVNQSIYGRANLPFDLDLGTDRRSGNSTRYLYDASDARIYKGLYELDGEGFELGDVNAIGAVVSSEYYLRDAAGNTIGILDLNTAKWTWYVFGRERFAKIKPADNQQPGFFTGDQLRVSEIDNTSDSYNQFVNEINDVLTTNPNEQNQLLHVECTDGTNFWLCEHNLTTFADTVPDTSYTIVDEITIKNKSQLMVIDNQLISVAVLAGIDTVGSDTIVVDTTRITYNSREPVVIIDPHTGEERRHQETPAEDPIFDYYTHSNIELKDISYYLHDHLGNTRVVYKPTFNPNYICNSLKSLGYKLEYAADYYPYGKILREFNPEAEKYLTTHHERDTETGLDYRGARYYDADVSRFLSLDPAAVKYPTLSAYNYVAGNPIIFIDPTGAVIDYAGRGARRSVRRARRRSSAFDKSFREQRASSDQFVYSKSGDGNARTGVATSPETSFTDNGDGTYTPEGASRQVHGSTNKDSNPHDVTHFRFTDRPAERVGVNQVIGAVPRADGTVTESSVNQYTSGTISVTGAGSVERAKNPDAKLEVIVSAGGKVIYQAPLPLNPEGQTGNTLESGIVNFKIENNTGNHRIKVKIKASDNKSANAGSVRVDIINDIQ